MRLFYRNVKADTKPLRKFMYSRPKFMVFCSFILFTTINDIIVLTETIFEGEISEWSEKNKIFEGETYKLIETKQKERYDALHEEMNAIISHLSSKEELDVTSKSFYDVCAQLTFNATTIKKISWSSVPETPLTEKEQVRSIIDNILGGKLLNVLDIMSHEVSIRTNNMYSKTRNVLVLPNAVFLQTKENDKNYKENTRYATTHVLEKNLCCHHPFDITLTTQLSPEKLPRFLLQSRAWNGPISAAIYISSNEAMELFLTFVEDHLFDFRHVVFHIYIEKLIRSYPHNILRNLALDNILTRYFFMVDVDLVTSPYDTHDRLCSFLSSYVNSTSHRSYDHKKKGSNDNNKFIEKRVFVLPALEYASDTILYDHNISHFLQSQNAHTSLSIVPGDKSETLARYRNNTIHGFHVDRVYFSYGPTNYRKWFLNETNSTYPVTYIESYEPYVIAVKNDDTPFFYPYFRGYGLNKNTWFKELMLNGYTIEVLRDFFLYHLPHEEKLQTQKKMSLRRNRNCASNLLKLWEQTYKNSTMNITIRGVSTPRVATPTTPTNDTKIGV